MIGNSFPVGLNRERKEAKLQENQDQRVLGSKSGGNPKEKEKLIN